MSPSPWKLIGIGLASVGLSAGAWAVAAGALAPLAQDKPPEAPPATRPDGKTGVDPVERRLDDLEAKLDRMAAMLSSLAPAPATPPLPPQPAADGDLDREHPARAAVGARGLREIEAQLLNALPDYQRAVAMHKRATVPKQAVDDCVKPVRILLARLLEMQDELREQEQSVERGLRALDERRQVRDATQEKMEKARNLEREGEELPPHRVDRLLRAVEYAELAVESSKQDVEKLLRSLALLRDRAKNADRLIHWTREHFGDIELSIDSVAEDAK